VVISTTVLPVLRKQYPDCQLAFLTSSESAIVLKKHPLVSKIHTFDHWYLHRHLGKCKAALHHLQQRRSVLRELAMENYDIAIDLYPYFPNSIPLLAQAQIPVRIGYPTGGFSKLLTHAIPWHFQDRYVGYAHLNLLQALDIDISQASPLPFYQYKKEPSPFTVVHMGSSDLAKEWDLNYWITLIQELETEGHIVLLTGKGTRETQMCAKVANRTTAKNLSNQLSWIEFVKTVQEAKLLISVDSVAVHIAAGALTPTLIYLTGAHPPQMWTPPTALVKWVMRGEYFSFKNLTYPQNIPT
jgi:ADP-heptose:LPS heptosyltransferase